MYKRINGLQHIGLSVADMNRSLPFFRKFFGLDIPFFDSVAAAPLMRYYTKGETITKRASMVMNLQGGCAMEIISPTSFKPRKAEAEVKVGDLGVFMVQMKSRDVTHSYEFCGENAAPGLSSLHSSSTGPTFTMRDLDGNMFQFIEGADWYTRGKHHSGGVLGCSVGVRDIERSFGLYREILGFDKVVSDRTGHFPEWQELPGGNERYRRVLLTQSAQPGGGFARVTGRTYIELVQALDRTPYFTYENRIWGDLGFVHIGFDVKGMSELGKDLSAKGYPFTCDSNDALNMGNTKVHCTYIHDLDHTLIELIEVYKVPIVEKWGVYLNVEKRDPLRPLPDVMLKALRFSRIRD